jgi:hypothetical protein
LTTSRAGEVKMLLHQCALASLGIAATTPKTVKAQAWAQREPETLFMIVDTLVA